MGRVLPRQSERRSGRSKQMLLSVLSVAFLIGSVPLVGLAETNNGSSPPPGRRPPAGRGSHGSCQQDENNNRQAMQQRQDGALGRLGNAIQAVAPLAVLGALAGGGGNQNSVQPTPPIQPTPGAQPTPGLLPPGQSKGTQQAVVAGSAGRSIETF